MPERDDDSAGCPLTVGEVQGCEAKAALPIEELGDIRTSVLVNFKTQKIFLQFDKPIEWLRMTAETATTLGEILTQAAIDSQR